jgi:hypothetical protein
VDEVASLWRVADLGLTLITPSTTGEVMSGHEHTKRCYWDYLEACWVCRPEIDEADQAVEFPAVVVTADEPVGATAASN